MKHIWFLLTALACPLLQAQDSARPEVAVPPELEPFVEAGARPIALAAADLDGDGRSDYLLVLERQRMDDRESDRYEGQRPLLVILREPSRKLKLAQRNDRVVACDTCGSDGADLFSAVEAGPESFSVHHQDASRSSAFYFRYSRSSRTWRLVKAEHARNPAAAPWKPGERVVHAARRPFNPVDFRQFDPDAYLQAGASAAAEPREGFRRPLAAAEWR